MKVKDVLRKKGPQVFTIGTDLLVADALDLMVKNRIGALLVLDYNGKIAGIISERDLLRLANSSPENFRFFHMAEVMTERVIYAEAEDDIEYVESIMTENRIRHVPIMHNKILVGILSIGDVVKSQLSDKKYENKYMIDYISGSA